MDNQENSTIITAIGPSDSRDKYYNGKFDVGGLWFTLEEMKERFEPVGLKHFPKKPYTAFEVKNKGGC